MSLATAPALQPSSIDTDPEFAAITTISLGDEGNVDRVRTVGIFPNADDARMILENDYGDLNEDNYYPYAVIESFGYGLYPTGRRPQWFRYTDSWEPLDECPVNAQWARHQPHFATLG